MEPVLREGYPPDLLVRVPAGIGDPLNTGHEIGAIGEAHKNLATVGRYLDCHLYSSHPGHFMLQGASATCTCAYRSASAGSVRSQQGLSGSTFCGRLPTRNTNCSCSGTGVSSSWTSGAHSG